MNLNYRDKVILIGVIVLLVWVAGIMWFIKPAIENVNTAQNTLDTKTAELDKLKKELEEQKKLPDKIKKAYAEVEEISKKFYDFQSAQKATHEVDSLLKKANLENTNMNISNYEQMSFSPYSYVDSLTYTSADELAKAYEEGKKKAESVDLTAQAATAADTQEIVSNLDEETGTADIIIGYYDVDFTFTGSASNVQKFCQNLVNDKSILVYNLDLPDVSSDKEDSSVTLKMIVVRKLQNPTELEAKDKASSSSDDSTDESSAS